MKKFVLTIDQGTTSTRAILFDHSGSEKARAQKPLVQYRVRDGWVEHDASEIWEAVLACIREVLLNSGTSLSQLAAIGITNQRETSILWDRTTGEPICRAICWQSRQSKAYCEAWIREGREELIHSKTGLQVNPYFSASKVCMMLDDVPGAGEKAQSGELCFGTVDSYLVYRLTQGALHITDVTNASRTMMFNITDMCWDGELLSLYDIPRSILPEVVGNSSIYGMATALHEIEPVDVPIASMIGDQQSSLFGQCCFEKGSVKNTYGTGCFMLMNTKSKPVFSSNGLLTTVAWQIDGQTEYALEGSVFVGGSAVQWLRDGLRLFEKSSDCEKYLKGSDGVYVVPAFVGLGTPYWDNDARGSVLGMTAATTRENIITATVESIAYQSMDVLEVMKREADNPIVEVTADGGASANSYLMQFQSDILNVPVRRPACLESTALGAAFLAGLAVGFWKDRQELKSLLREETIFKPVMKVQTREDLYRGWKSAVEATRSFRRE